ncbi:P-loop containing nucleoside triphosphate hydrolase protein [Mycena sp. CBHHK59/15]|nr:P-loop containing nucleoside triphosphate hydrolase protein [Mycena sp. CBHHK59/15]
MPTSSDNNSKSQASAAAAWRSFGSLCEAGQRVFELVSQLLFISQQKSGCPLFTLLAMVKPLLTLKLVRTLWMKPYVQFSENSMSGGQFRGTATEYHKACKALGLFTDAHAFTVYATHQTPFPKIATELCGDLQTLYWAVSAMLRPGKFPMTSIAILQQYSSTLNHTLQSLFWDFSRLASCVSQIKLLYEAAEIENKILDGAYPRPGADATQGMDIELRDVSFAYSGDKSKDAALRDVSLRISAGSLAVIGGANGGGKSTIIKLLTRMYDTDAGTALVDGLPIARHRLAALRQAQATLTQHHSLYPRRSRRISASDMVLQAAADGGAAELLDKFKDGAQPNLDPVSTAYGYELDDEQHKALKALLGKLEKTAEVSGGEKQHLVASRTFMRFRTGKTKLLCIDEPSSALDPMGEHALFEHLRETGAGRTMIFVTHRFGHLTKYVDIIICMKESKVAESGTHTELIALDGEYASLYNVQAQAFAEEVASEQDEGKTP